MTKFVEAPNLTDNSDAVLVGERYRDILAEAFEKLGINALWVPDNMQIDRRLSGHADLSVFHAGGKKIFLAPYLADTKLCADLKRLGFEPSFPAITQKPEYPQDAQMNICVVGDHYFCRRDIVPDEIADYLENDLKLVCIDCRQGYSRCSVCVADADSIITSDAGIAAAAEKNGLEVLKIQEGYISLTGFPYGFIGGACFKAGENVLAFTGRLDIHPDKSRIESFLTERGIVPIFLSELPIFDVGGILPITEK